MASRLMLNGIYLTQTLSREKEKEEVSLLCTGKFFSEALILASTNPQYDKRLIIELQVQYMEIPSSEHGKNMLCA